MNRRPLWPIVLMGALCWLGLGALLAGPVAWGYGALAGWFAAPTAADVARPDGDGPRVASAR